MGYYLVVRIWFWRYRNIRRIFSGNYYVKGVNLILTMWYFGKVLSMNMVNRFVIGRILEVGGVNRYS